MAETSVNKKTRTKQALIDYKSRLMDNLIREKKFPANIQKFMSKLREILFELMKLLREK
jgi:hypothetical protein